MSSRCRALRAVAFSFGLTGVAAEVLAIPPVSDTMVDVVFLANTRDVHLSIGGRITKVTLPPTLMPSGSETSGGTYGVGFAAPPGAGTYTFMINRMGTGKWAGRISLSTDGSGLAIPPAQPTQFFSGLFPGLNFGDNGLVSLFADNGDGPGGLLITNIQVGVLANIDSLDDPDFNLPGTLVNLPNATLGAGASDVLVGSLNLTANDGLRVTANYNGVPMTYRYVVPEPGVAGVLGAAGAMGLLWRRRV